MIIAIDFDGTCVTHNYPEVGDSIGAEKVLKKLVEKEHKLILYTMRCDSGVKSGLFKSGLTDAINWFKENNIPLFGIQINPEQKKWTKSPKCYAQLYIDDAALGCPLVYPKNGDRPYADWKKIEKLLTKQEIL